MQEPSAPDPAATRDPATRARILLIVLVFAATMLNYVDRQVLSLLKPTLEAEFGWTNSEFAHLGSVFQFTTAAALLGVGWFVDRFGVRFAYGLAVLVWSLAGMAHAFASSVQHFVIARMTLAAAEAVNTPAAMKAAGLYLPVKQRSMAIGIVNTAPNFGAIFIALIIPPFAVAFGWHAAFLVTGALGFVWLGFWVIGTRSLTPINAAPQTERAKVNWGELFSDRRSWAVIGAKGFTDLVWWFIAFWMPDYFAKVWGLSQAELGGPLALVYTLAAFGALSSGAVFPLLLGRGFSVNFARKSSMLFYALVVLVFPLATYASSPWIAAAFIGIGLFAHQGFSTNIFGMATDIVPTARLASVIAMGAVAGNLSGMGMIEFTGWSLDEGYGYGPLFAICGGAYLTALAWIMLMQPKLQLDAA